MQLADSSAEERKADDGARLGSLEPGIDLGQWMRDDRGAHTSPWPEEDEDDEHIDAGSPQGVWVYHPRPVDA